MTKGIAVIKKKWADLWTVKHAYYCADQNWLEAIDKETRFSSWDEFIRTYGQELDCDLNLVFRWDWTSGRLTRKDKGDEIKLYFIEQRRGHFRPVTIEVKRSDQKAIRAWLKQHKAYLQALWEDIEL